MAFPAPNEIPEPESMLMVVAARTTENKNQKETKKILALL